MRRPLRGRIRDRGSVGIGHPLSNRLAKTVVLLWLALAAISFIGRSERVFPTGGYSTATFLLAVPLGVAVYRRVLKNQDLASRSRWGRWGWVYGGQIFFPIMLWYSMLKPIPLVTAPFASAPLDTVVTIEYRESSIRSRPCRHSFKIRELGFMDELCVDQRIWEQGRSGGKVRLTGRQHALAWYVDKVRLK